MGGGEVLALHGVGKRYGRGRWILREVDLSVRAGEVVRVSGVNGSGKSTLLRLAAGACRPSVGSLRSGRSGVRYVPDRVAVTPRMPVGTFLVHMGRLQGLTREQASRRTGELLDRFEVDGGTRSAIGRLSKGNAQKVLLAQAVLTPPTLLVLDEPSSGLDDRAQLVLADLLGEAVEAGGAVVYADHDGDFGRERVTAGYAIVDGHLGSRQHG